jgi:SAM-dependent methyltransferase
VRVNRAIIGAADEDQRLGPRARRGRALSPLLIDDDWGPYILAGYDHCNFDSGARVLDLGFGRGAQLRALAARGCRPVGIETDACLAREMRRSGFAIVLARGEELPFRPAAFDGVLSKVVLPYTDEERAVREVARVLRGAGVGELATHGAGYYLRYLLMSRSLKRRVYALRTLINTMFYRITGRRLAGDTLYQSRWRMALYGKRYGLSVVRLTPSPRFLGLPVFQYLRVAKRA